MRREVEKIIFDALDKAIWGTKSGEDVAEVGYDAVDEIMELVED